VEDISSAASIADADAVGAEVGAVEDIAVTSTITNTRGGVIGGRLTTISGTTSTSDSETSATDGDVATNVNEAASDGTDTLSYTSGTSTGYGGNAPASASDASGGVTRRIVEAGGTTGGVTRRIVEAGGDTTATGEEATTVEALAEERGATQVFQFDKENNTWIFFDPRPEFADANTLTGDLDYGAAVWIRTNGDATSERMTGAELIAIVSAPTATEGTGTETTTSSTTTTGNTDTTTVAAATPVRTPAATQAYNNLGNVLITISDSQNFTVPESTMAIIRSGNYEQVSNAVIHVRNTGTDGESQTQTFTLGQIQAQTSVFENNLASLNTQLATGIPLSSTQQADFDFYTDMLSLIKAVSDCEEEAGK